MAGRKGQREDRAEGKKSAMRCILCCTSVLFEISKNIPGARDEGGGSAGTLMHLFCKPHIAAEAKAYLNDNHSISVPSGEGVLSLKTVRASRDQPVMKLIHDWNKLVLMSHGSSSRYRQSLLSASKIDLVTAQWPFFLAV
jgi:hypothetical protein